MQLESTEKSLGPTDWPKYLSAGRSTTACPPQQPLHTTAERPNCVVLQAHGRVWKAKKVIRLIRLPSAYLAQ